MPGKLDHGDIDALVDKQLYNFTREELEIALGAERHVQAGNNSSFAIRLPHDNDGEDNYFQLDVRLCTPGQFEWETIMCSYGDMWQILGATVTRVGFAINDSGLHTRIEEIEKTHRKDSLLFLTYKPGEIMEFLGLDFPRFEGAFSTREEVFDWATGSKLFRFKSFEKEMSDKHKKSKRVMYEAFVREWLPREVELGRLEMSAPCLDRQELLEEALERFGKRHEYGKMLQDHCQRLSKDAMWKKIAKVLPLEGTELGQAIVALKTSLWWMNGTPTLQIKSKGQDEKVPALDDFNVDEILIPWVRDHWREALDLNKKKSGTEP